MALRGLAGPATLHPRRQPLGLPPLFLLPWLLLVLRQYEWRRAPCPRCDIQAHEAADGGGRRIPDPHLLRFQEAEPALGVKIGLIDDTRDPVGQRRDDAVGRARDLARISSAPEDIVRVEV